MPEVLVHFTNLSEQQYNFSIQSLHTRKSIAVGQGSHIEKRKKYYSNETLHDNQTNSRSINQKYQINQTLPYSSDKSFKSIQHYNPSISLQALKVTNYNQATPQPMKSQCYTISASMLWCQHIHGSHCLTNQRPRNQSKARTPICNQQHKVVTRWAQNLVTSTPSNTNNTWKTRRMFQQ